MKYHFFQLRGQYDRFIMGLSLAMGCYLLIGLGLVQVTGRCFLGKAPGNEIVAAIPFSRLNDFTFFTQLLYVLQQNYLHRNRSPSFVLLPSQ